MVFNIDAISFFLFGTAFFWLIGLSFFLIRAVRHYDKLTRGVSGSGLKSVLTAIVDRQKHIRDRVSVIEEKHADLEKACTFHVQRVGIVRFNPFDDTGGSQSFSMALLDGLDNGIVITSLHGRAGNRWYVKEIKNATGESIELSREEREAIKKARHSAKS